MVYRCYYWNESFYFPRIDDSNQIFIASFNIHYIFSVSVTIRKKGFLIFNYLKKGFWFLIWQKLICHMNCKVMLSFYSFQNYVTSVRLQFCLRVFYSASSNHFVFRNYHWLDYVILLCIQSWNDYLSTNSLVLFTRALGLTLCSPEKRLEINCNFWLF